jgi:uncharacterized FlgJ-related protein
MLQRHRMTSCPNALGLIAAITLSAWGQSALTRNASVDD